MYNGSMFEVSMREHFREMQYLRDRLKEAEGVIEQIHRGYPIPGKPVYIHPADFSVIMEAATKDVTFALNYNTDANITSSNSAIIKGIHYIQTTAMPKITKLFD